MPWESVTLPQGTRLYSHVSEPDLTPGFGPIGKICYSYFEVFERDMDGERV